MNQGLCDELLAMQKEDFRVREELLKAGLLGEGYQPRMEAVHRKNAARLREIVGHHGPDVRWSATMVHEQHGSFCSTPLVSPTSNVDTYLFFKRRRLKATFPHGSRPT